MLSLWAQLEIENDEIADWLLQLTTAHKTWGLCFLYLRNIKGLSWNHKRVYRIYRALELNLGIKPRKRLVRERPAPLACRNSLTGPGRWTSWRTSLPTAVRFEPCATNALRLR
jgi:putative transposase